MTIDNRVTEEEKDDFLNRFIQEPKDLTSLITYAVEEAQEMCFDDEEIIKSLEYSLYVIKGE
jgi:hypothetical protein